ncbi:MAG: hypothetical protein GX046_01245 [Tissierellia bacterium]|nr:hypothetical protein [Tissierellia bacterium]
MKKTKLLILVLLTLSLILSCSKADQSPSQEKLMRQSELREFYNNHTPEEVEEKRKEVQTMIDNASFEEISNIIEDSFQKWLDTQNILEIDGSSIEITKDHLLMDEVSKNKLYNNLFIKIDIQYDYKKNLEPLKNLPQNLYEPVREALMETVFGALTIRSIDINGTNIGTYLIINPMIPKQSEEELKLQSVAYDFVQEFNQSEFSSEPFTPHGNVALRRIGIKPNTKEFYIEIPIFEVDYEKDVEQFKESLKDKAENLFKRITDHNELKEYLGANQVDTITVEFYTPWDKEPSHIYRYDLE